MCGIAGIWTPGSRPERETLERMVRAMVHRGPDGVHFWNDDEIALGMRRLAIIDLPGGAQPLTNETRDVFAVFNGEIYNHSTLRAELIARGHRFDTGSDGAVIPHLYEEIGTKLFSRLNGIFAVALWDADSQTLVLARDQAGVKPLYVHRRNGQIRFASEIKALLQDPVVPRELDIVGLDQHLTFRFTPAPRTLLRGIEKIEPGTALVCRGGAAHREPFWKQEAAVRRDLSFSEASDEFRDRLREAVRRQMMSDRPIGAMLSGGVDSAAIVGLMAEVSSQVKTFTIGFEGGGDADETGLARQTAELFGTEHHELIVGGSDFTEELPRVVEMLEEPVGTSSALGFRAVSRLAKDHVPVLLSGQGADELLAGYWRYVGEWLAGTVLRLPPPLPRLGEAVGRLSEKAHSARLERGLRALRQPDVLKRFMDIYAVFTDAQKHDFYTPEFAAEIAAGDEPSPAERVERLRQDVATRDTLDQMMHIDVRLWLPDDLLLVGDKMSMAESVEMRVPFLDMDLVRFVESLPSSFKMRRGRRKAIEKAALEPLLPRTIIHRKERGFITPMDRWLRTDMFDSARDLLLSPDSHATRLFRQSAVTRMLEVHRSGEFDFTRQIFGLLSFEIWARRFLAAPS